MQLFVESVKVPFSYADVFITKNIAKRQASMRIMIIALFSFGSIVKLGRRSLKIKRPG